MTLLDAVLLGIVEGVTEFLPVSSTGHLLLVQRALGMERTTAADSYAICIQAGAIAAVLGLYRQRIGRVLRGDPLGPRIVVAFLPAAVIGFLFDDWIEEKLFGLWPVVVAWAVGGVAILAFRRSGQRPLEDLDLRTAVAIGFAQCLAMWPGTSRSLVTMLAAMLLGMSVPAAVEFSFLLGVVTLGAATAYSGLKHGAEMVSTYGPLPITVGFVTSFLSAAVSIKWLVGWLGSHGLEVFAAWRMGLAAIVAALLVAGVLPAG